MKLYKILVAAAVVLLFPLNSSAWDDFGHKTIVELAKRHLKPEIREILAKNHPCDIAEDNSYMDEHRKDAGLEFAYSWHNYMMDPQTLEMNLNYGFRGGNTVTGLEMCKLYLSQYSTLTQEYKELAIRLAIHFVGDLHCPVHVWYIAKVQNWPCYINGKKVGSWHGFFDRAPDRHFALKTELQAAEILDTYSPAKIRKVSKGNPIDWAKETAKRSRYIYEINKTPEGPENYNKPMELRPDTDELSWPLIEYQMQAAGYRLAAFLNKYLK